METAPVEVLLVDDRPENLQSLSALIAGPDRVIRTATSGEQALRLMLHHEFAVVLLDVQMPSMDGFEVARLMRASQRTRHTPIIFVTGVDRTRANIFAGYDAGAVDFLTKPLEPHVVQSKVEVFLALARQQRQLRAQATALEKHVAELTAAHDALHQKTAALERSDAAVRSLNMELERRVAVRTRDLARANEQLEAFVFSASHNLRTPLRTIAGFISIVLDECTGVLPPEERDLLERVEVSASHMGSLLNALLCLSRLSHATAERTSVDLAEIARRVVQGLQWRAPDRAVEVILPETLPADADPDLAAVILEVLLDNAWKFTARVESARIEMGVVPGSRPQVVFVRDNGAGFDPNDIDRLFRPFQRLHSPKVFEGTGLGLATVRQAVLLHHGSVWAEGQQGEGAQFCFTLAPSADTVAAETGAAQRAEAASFALDVRIRGEAINTLLAALGDSTLLQGFPRGAELDGVRDGEFYPISLYVDLTDFLEHELGRGAMRRLGHAIGKMVSDRMPDDGSIRNPRDAIAAVHAVHEMFCQPVSGGFLVVDAQPGLVRVEYTAPYNCALQEGLLDEVARLHGSARPLVTQERCRRRGDPVCTYRIHY